MRIYLKKYEFFKEISSREVLNKMQRLITECTDGDTKCDVLKDINNRSQELFNNNVEELERTIEHKLNEQSALGKLFHVLGTMDNIIQFNETEKNTVTSRFDNSLMKIFRFFLGNK